MIAFEFD